VSPEWANPFDTDEEWDALDLSGVTTPGQVITAAAVGISLVLSAAFVWAVTEVVVHVGRRMLGNGSCPRPR
jgi:hypothetical protein